MNTSLTNSAEAFAQAIATKALRQFVFCNEEWVRAASVRRREIPLAAMRAEAVNAAMDAMDAASATPERAEQIADAAVARILEAGCVAIGA